MLACADLREELGFDLLGLAHRGLGLAGDLLLTYRLGPVSGSRPA